MAMVMDTLAQTFVVAPSNHRTVSEDEASYQDDDSASFYDEDDQSFCSDDGDDDSEGSLQQSFLGTAKYFGGSANLGSANLEPQMMGFSDSFVTDGDCSECFEDLCEQDFASPSASPILQLTLVPAARTAWKNRSMRMC